MPQLVPLYFTSQVFYGLLILSILIFILSKFILPHNLKLFIIRKFISNL